MLLMYRPQQLLISQPRGVKEVHGTSRPHCGDNQRLGFLKLDIGTPADPIVNCSSINGQTETPTRTMAAQVSS